MNILNATPYSYNQGFKDDSGEVLAPQPIALPSHLPKVFGWAKKGPINKSEFVVGSARSSIYGTDSFDPLKPWFNHSTLFANAFNSVGNAVMFERLMPADAKPAAGLRLCLDLLKTQVQDYERNSDGSYRIDAQGNKVPTASKVAGYLGKWVVEQIPLDEDGVRMFGQATIKDGNQTDTLTSVQSKRYPIMEFLASSPGEWGNNLGISIWANTQVSSTKVDTTLIQDQKVYPFNIAVKTRTDELSSPTIYTSLAGSQSVPFVLKPKTINRATTQKLDLNATFVKAYQDTSTPGVTPTYGPFGQIKTYDANIAEVLGLLYAAEFPVSEGLNDLFSDFDGSADEMYRFNPFTAVSSYNVPYHTFQLVTGAADSVRMTQTATMFALDGSDGTMTDEAFDLLVRAKLQEYGDINSNRQDAVNNPENIFWDSGFSLETKKAMANFIAVRKNTYVQASTHITGGPSLSDEEARSLAITLVTAFQNFPESEVYGTPTVRASIITGSGYALGVDWDQELPITLDRATAWATYMGASNGKWKPSAKPDVKPGNQVSTMRDINIPFRPINARYQDWEAGMVWPEPFSMGREFFAQHQTVYQDDTSVLNAAIVAFGCTTMVSIGEQAHRNNTGRSDKTRDEMIDLINADILAAVKDVYDGRFEITPETTYTADDDLRGYSWTTVIKVGASVAQTVQTLTINTYRRDEANTTS